MQQRSDNAILPYVAAAGIILFTPIFFIFAFWIYKIVRPHEKIGEVWERNLAEEALLAEVESIHHCPACERRIDDEWIICPNCRTRLKRVCPNCSRLVGMDWSLCAWCGKDFERREVPAAAAIEALPRGREGTGRIAARRRPPAPPSSATRCRPRSGRRPRLARGPARRTRRPAGSAARALIPSDPPPDPPSSGNGGPTPSRPARALARRPVPTPTVPDGPALSPCPGIAARRARRPSPSRAARRRPVRRRLAGDPVGVGLIVVALLSGGATRRSCAGRWPDPCCPSG